MSALHDVLRLSQPSVAELPFRRLGYEPGPTGLAALGKKAVLACTSRSGSTLVCTSLRRYGLNFDDWFNAEGRLHGVVEEHGPMTTRGYADHLAANMPAAGVFGVKTGYAGLLYLVAFGEIPSGVERWKFVFLRRRNLIRQAISAQVASVTRQWTADWPRAGDVRVEDYSYAELKRRFEALAQQNAKWERFFVLFGIEPLRVAYEDFLADQDGCLAAINAFVGGERAAPEPMGDAFRVEPQSTELNTIWERRFRSDFMGEADGLQAALLRAAATPE
jgi:LPS sulfotransferase NodH